MPGPGPGDEGDRRAARTFRAALVVRLVAGAAIWAWTATPWWAGVAFVAGPAWGFAEAPDAAVVNADRRKACIDAATAGFWLLVTSALAASAGLAVLAATSFGWTATGRGGLAAAVALVALVPPDYALLRLGFRVAPDATESV